MNPSPSQRRIKRQQLPCYLEVFNRHTDRPLGYIGNLSLDGLLLISQLPLLVGARFELRLKLPGQKQSQNQSGQFVDFAASCQWCHEDVTPGYYDSGFALVAPPADYLELVDALRLYLSFHDDDRHELPA